MTKAIKITDESKKVFLAYAEDSGNWGGEPLVGGNVGGSKEERGNLTQLKRAGLIETFSDKYEKLMYVRFTASGVLFAREHGIELRDYTWRYPELFATSDRPATE